MSLCSFMVGLLALQRLALLCPSKSRQGEDERLGAGCENGTLSRNQKGKAESATEGGLSQSSAGGEEAASRPRRRATILFACCWHLRQAQCLLPLLEGNVNEQPRNYRTRERLAGIKGYS